MRWLNSLFVLLIASCGWSQTVLNSEVKNSGVFLITAKEFAYPNGEKKSKISLRARISLVDSSGVLFDGGFTDWFMAGKFANNSFTVNAPLFGSDFEKAPASIQTAISNQRLVRTIVGKYNADFDQLEGNYTAHFARWRGEELQGVDSFKVPYLGQRVAFRVKGHTVNMNGYQEGRIESQRRLNEAQRYYEGTRNTFDLRKSELAIWKTRLGVAQDALRSAKDRHLASLQNILIIPENLKTAEYRRVTAKRVRNENRVNQILSRVDYLKNENTAASRRAMGPLAEEGQRLVKENRALDTQIANLERRLGISAHQDRARAAANVAYDRLWTARAELAKQQSDRDRAGRLADGTYDEFVNAHEAFGKAQAAYSLFQEADLPIIKSVTMSVPGEAYRAELFGPEDALQVLDRQIAVIKNQFQEISDLRRQCRERFDTQRPLIQEAELGLARGQWYSALSQAGIEFAVGFYEFWDAFATGGFVGLGAEAAKKLAEAYFGGTDYIVESQVIPPGGIEQTAMELTHQKAALAAGKKVGSDAIQNLWKAGIDTGAGLSTTGFQAKQLAEAEGEFRRLFAAMVDKSPDMYRGRWTTKLREFLTGATSPEVAISKLQAESAVKLKEIGDLDKRLADLTRRNGWTGVAREFSKSFAKGLLLDAGKAAAKQAVADYFEGQAWLKFTEEATKLKAFSHSLLLASTHYWETRDMLDGLIAIRRAIAKSFDPTTGMLIAGQKPFYFVQPPIVSLQLTPNSNYDPSKLQIKVTWGDQVLEPIDGTSLTFRASNMMPQINLIPVESMLKIEYLPKSPRS